MSRQDKRKGGKVYEPELTKHGYFLWDCQLIRPNRNQPRKYFAEDAMAGLRKSIKRMGILNPIRIKVTDPKNGQAIIVDGERRFRIACELGLEKIPVVRDDSAMDDLLKKSVVMNFCREDMSEIEVAHALATVMKRYDYNQTEVAEICGKSNAWVSNMLKLLKLDPKVAKGLEDRKITPAIAKVAARFSGNKQPEIVAKLQEAAEKKGRPLTVHEVSLAAAKISEEIGVKPSTPQKKSRPVESFATLKVKSIVREAEQTGENIAELLCDVSAEDLSNVAGEYLLNLENCLGYLKTEVEKLLDQLKVAI